MEKEEKSVNKTLDKENKCSCIKKNCIDAQESNVQQECITEPIGQYRR